MHWYFNQARKQPQWSLGYTEVNIFSGKHSWISFYLLFFCGVFWDFELTCMGTLRGRTSCGSLKHFLDGWWWRLKLCPQTSQQERAIHWSFTRLRTLKATTCLIHAQVVQVQGYSRGDIHGSHYVYSPLVINTMACKHMKFLMELVWTERMFFPIDSLFSGDQVIKPEELNLYYFSINSLAPQLPKSPSTLSQSWA